MADKLPPDPEFETLLRYIQESRGVDFRGYKRSSLSRRIALRMEATSTEDYNAYRAHLEAQPSEFEDLLDTVLINVTSFFRDGEAWETLKTQVIPKVIENAGEHSPIRVWSVGCASGQEPYSLAMLFAEAMGAPDFSRRVKIYATDLDEEALRLARAAVYSPRDVEGVPAELLDKYFDRTHHHYVFERELRKCVIFGRHNVVHDAPISRIDLLSCRNLLIYLESDTQDIVLPRLHYALNRDGYLFLGKAETQLARSAMFRAVDMRHRIFAKVPQEWRRPVSRLITSQFARVEQSTADTRLLDAVVNESSSAMLVIDEQGIVRLANLSARLLLGVGEADLGRPFQDLPISYRPIELRGPMDQVLRENIPTRFDDQEFHLAHGDTLRLTIELRPLPQSEDTIRAVLIVFHDNTRVHALQRELEAAQANLEQSIEELQSANEELETTNEELQSTNEELETTNEELQSTNEELNEELRLSADQASNYRHHLEAVLRVMNDGARKKLGFPEQQLATMTLPDVMPTVSTEDVQALFARVITGGEPEIVFETRLRDARGADRPVEICVQYFGAEDPPILVAMVHDIADRTRLGDSPSDEPASNEDETRH